jgi:hypothetical protein
MTGLNLLSLYDGLWDCAIVTMTTTMMISIFILKDLHYALEQWLQIEIRVDVFIHLQYFCLPQYLLDAMVYCTKCREDLFVTMIHVI